MNRLAIACTSKTQVGERDDMRVLGARSSGSNDAHAQAAGEGEAAHQEVSIDDHRDDVEAPPWGLARPRLEPRSHHYLKGAVIQMRVDKVL